MVNSYEACSSAISVFLLVLSILEICITIVPLITEPDLLRFTGTHLAAVCGLIAGLVTLPASIRLKFNEASPDLEKLHGHSSFFKKLTLFMSLIWNVIAAILTVVALLTLKKFSHDFGRLMKVYHCNAPARVLVNWIQVVLECCGSISYKDWLSVNWRMYEISNDEDSIEEDNSDAVPYSCCNNRVPIACGHYDLRTYGTCSIYKHGCAKFLRQLTKRYLWVLFTIYMVNIALLVLLLVIYFTNKPKKPKEKKNNKEKTSVVAGYARMEGSPWEGMSNCSKESDRSSKTSDKTMSLRESMDSDGSNICESSLDEDGTPELTSSHKQVRIFSPLGRSRRNIRADSEK